jgi:threonyl-tRNA synthetase
MNKKSLLNSFNLVAVHAVQSLYKNVKFVESQYSIDGLYIDFDMEPVSETDFVNIESKIHQLLSEELKFNIVSLNRNDAIKLLQDKDQIYREKLISDFFDNHQDQTTIDLCIFYDFIDMVDHKDYFQPLKAIKYFKLIAVSGVFEEGNSRLRQFQRLHFVVFENEQDMKDYFDSLQEAKLRDHRRLGTELDLFVFSDLVGAGLPMFTPRGTILREELSQYSNSLRLDRGFQKVFIPHLTKKDLYEKSGHWAKFGDELFLVTSQETSDQLILKPMNCPHHTRIYASKPRSYKDMPVRYLETTTVYRDEKTGELGGLNRVRSITQDDSHVFCRNDQIEQEISFLLEAAQSFYATIGMQLKVRLSYRDESNSYLGSQKVWQDSQMQLKKAVENNNLEYFEQEGEAAFYGPKIDFMATDALNREHQVATIQLDFVQPERFELSYIDKNSQKQTPIMIHCALMGSIERFLSVYIEHTNGNFPLWVAPEQLRVVSVNQEEELVDFINTKIVKKAKGLSIRIVFDNERESVSKKIKQAENLKVPYVLVIGQKEMELGLLNPRIRADLRNNDQELKPISIDDFFNSMSDEIIKRSQKTFFDQDDKSSSTN